MPSYLNIKFPNQAKNFCSFVLHFLIFCISPKISSIYVVFLSRLSLSSKFNCHFSQFLKIGFRLCSYAWIHLNLKILLVACSAFGLSQQPQSVCLMPKVPKLFLSQSHAQRKAKKANNTKNGYSRKTQKECGIAIFFSAAMRKWRRMFCGGFCSFTVSAFFFTHFLCVLIWVHFRVVFVGISVALLNLLLLF